MRGKIKAKQVLRADSEESGLRSGRVIHSWHYECQHDQSYKVKTMITRLISWQGRLRDASGSVPLAGRIQEGRGVGTGSSIRRGRRMSWNCTARYSTP